MKKAIAFIFTLLSMFTPLQAQDLKPLTLEDLNFGGKNYYHMIPQNRYTTWWGDVLVRLDVEDCFVVDKVTGKETILFSLNDLNAWSGAELRHLYNLQFPEEGKTWVWINDGKHRRLFDWKAKKTLWQSDLEKAKHAQAESFSAVSRNLAYVKDHQLHVLDAQGNDQQFTTDGSKNIVYGQSVHRNEFGINGGLFWNGDGTKLAFYRMDQSMVANYPQVDIPELDWKPKDGESRMATLDPDPYPMAGETSHQGDAGADRRRMAAFGQCKTQPAVV